MKKAPKTIHNQSVNRKKGHKTIKKATPARTAKQKGFIDEGGRSGQSHKANLRT